jgi:hypothetical protein
MKQIQITKSWKDNNENVFNFYDPNTNKGGLISFRPMENGELKIDLYRMDKGINVMVSEERE